MTYIAGNGDKHELFARPDVKVVRRYPKLDPRPVFGAGWDGLNLEFTPESVDILLLVVHSSVFHEMIPDRGVGAIGSDHQVEADLYLTSASAIL